MSMYKVDYTVESGAEKRRKKLKEQEDWESQNGPIIIMKAVKND